MRTLFWLAVGVAIAAWAPPLPFGDANWIVWILIATNLFTAYWLIWTLIALGQNLKAMAEMEPLIERVTAYLESLGR